MLIIDLLLAGVDHWGGRRVVTRSLGLGLGPHEGGDHPDVGPRLDSHDEDHQPDIPHPTSRVLRTQSQSQTITTPINQLKQPQAS